MINLGFDSTYYLDNNPDVAQAVAGGTFASAFQHFEQFGKNELFRDPNAFFDTSAYASQNEDVLNAVSNGSIASAYDHFIEFGIGEDRDGTPDFDPAFYRNENEDVANNYDPNGDGSLSAGEAFDHFVKFGSAEGRAPTEEAANAPAPGLELTQGADDLVGGAADDTFTARLAQNELGGVTNTLGSGDQLDGQGGTDELVARVISENTAVGGQSPVIEPTTTSVENFFFQAQGQEVPLFTQLVLTEEETLDAPGVPRFFQQDIVDLTDLANELDVLGPVTIDAGDMNGVEQLWSKESRSDLQIEDVRANPNTTTIGMDGTDPFQSYFVKFDADAIEGNLGDSAVTYELANLNNPGDELNIGQAGSGGWVEALEFTIEGQDVTLDDADIQAATTYTELETAVNTALDDRGFTDLSLSLDESFNAPANVGGASGAQLVITDPQGRELSQPNIVVADQAPSGALFFNSEVGSPDVQAVETNIVLDNVGRNDQGGILDIGGMSNKGVEVFNVEVDAKSWLARMQSTSVTVDPDTSSFQHLDVVNVSHLDGGAQGDLVIGTQIADEDTDSQTDDAVTSLPTGGRVNTDGLKDVKEFNAEGFSGAINLGVSLTDEIFGRYLDDAPGEVQFTYQGGNGGNLFTFEIAEDVASDPDFALDIIGGESNDRFNLQRDPDNNDFNLQNISLDGGAGGDNNIVEVQTDIGTGASSTPEQFDNIETLILAGDNDVDANLDPAGDIVLDVSTLIIATGEADDGGDNSTINNLDADATSVTISGRNQTRTDDVGNSDGSDANDDQSFGTIQFDNVTGDSITINLENTARVDGELVVNTLTVSDDTPEEVVINSDAERDRAQQNTILNFVAAASTSVVLEGNTDLNLTITDLGRLVGSGDDDETVNVTAQNAPDQQLDGDLTLAVDGSVLNGEGGSDLDEDELTGAVGDNDLLVLYNALSGDGPTVSDFETLQFGGAGNPGAEGTYDAGNTSDVNAVVIDTLSNALTVDNLNSGADVTINQGAANNDITLSGPGSGDVSIGVSSGVLPGSGLLSGVNTLAVDEFATVELDVPRPGASVSGTPANLTVDLELDGFGSPNATTDGGSLFAATDAGVVNGDVTTLNITGGASGEPDSLTFANELPANLDTIDVSDYNGLAEFTMGNTVDATGGTSQNTDTEFKIGSNDVDITMTDPVGGGSDRGDGVDFNSIFRFEDAGNPLNGDGESIWTIENFITENLADTFGASPGDTNPGADNTNLSTLDLSEFGFADLTELDLLVEDRDGIDNSGGGGVTDDLVIRDAPDGSEQFEIVLIGVDNPDAVTESENFIL